MGEIPVERVGAAEARRRFAELVNAVASGERRVLIEKSGVPVAAVVGPRELRMLERADRERAEADAALARMRAAFADVPPDELQREIDKAVAEARAEMRAEREARDAVAR